MRTLFCECVCELDNVGGVLLLASLRGLGFDNAYEANVLAVVDKVREAVMNESESCVDSTAVSPQTSRSSM